MGELYWGCFERTSGQICAVGAEAVTPPELVRLPPSWDPSQVCGGGSGFALASSVTITLVPGLAQVWPEVHPRAGDIAMLAAAAGIAQAVSAADAQPVYLRDRVAEPARA